MIVFTLVGLLDLMSFTVPCLPCCSGILDIKSVHQTWSIMLGAAPLPSETMPVNIDQVVRR